MKSHILHYILNLLVWEECKVFFLTPHACLLRHSLCLVYCVRKCALLYLSLLSWQFWPVDPKRGGAENGWHWDHRWDDLRAVRGHDRRGATQSWGKWTQILLPFADAISVWLSWQALRLSFGHCGCPFVNRVATSARSGTLRSRHSVWRMCCWSTSWPCLCVYSWPSKEMVLFS